VLVLALTSAFVYSIFYNTFWGGPIAKFKPKYAASVALPYVVAAVYAYAIWGPRRLVHIYIRGFLIVGLAVGWLYLVLSILAAITALPSLGYAIFDKVCHARRSGETMGAMAGFLMVIEVVFTLKFGIVGPSSVKDQD